MRILVDMDGVLADFERSFLTRWRASYPDLPYVALTNRRHFFLEQDYPPACHPTLSSIFTAPGFFRELPPIPGGKAALTALQAQGHDVLICTSPLSSYHHCVLEKYEWVEQHLGFDWTLHIILLRDKTLVQGDILIDDRPHITGAITPSWEHVLYDQPYNRRVDSKRRLTWASWQTVLFPSE